MANVHSELTFTVNLGNYQTVKITAGFEDTLACVEAAMPGILAQVADVRR